MQPRLRRGRLAALRQQCLARQLSRLPCPALQSQQGGCNGEDEDGDDDGDGSEDEVALQGDTEAVPGARDGLAHHEQAVSTGCVQFRCRGTSGRTSDVAHLLGAFQVSSCRSLAAFGRVVGEGAASLGYFVPERLAQTLDNTERALLQRVAWRRSSWAWCLRPTKMFLLLEDTDLGEVFVKTWQTKKCMFDDISAAYTAKYKVAGFVHREAKVVLQQVAQSMRMDIADIESRHASWRRNKANMSVQVGRSLAKRQRAGGRGVISVVATRQKRSEGSNIKKRRAVRSAWATFISEESAEKKADFRELSDKRNISHEEYQRLQARGSLVAPSRGEKRKHRAFVTPRLRARQQAQTKLRTEQWRHSQHERSQTRVFGQHVGYCKSHWRKDVSLPREASREARFYMAMGVLTGHSRRCSCINLAIDTLADDFPAHTRFGLRYLGIFSRCLHAV